jgi:glycerol-1-phosphate dehydrogenase [NAD(P)+]
MPLLARTLTSPLFVDIRPGAVANLANLLTERRISEQGTVIVAVGSGQGTAIWDLIAPSLPFAERFDIAGPTLKSAHRLQEWAGHRSYDAIVGIGGGGTLDVAKYAATRMALPMIAVATSLAHDGICSPVSSLITGRRKGSYGVAMPLGVVVDLDYVRAAPAAMVTGGVGDVVSNLSAIADWRLAEAVRGEAVDGLAVAFARTSGEAVVDSRGAVTDDEFLTTLAESLVLSGMAMSVAGTSRPCSGACHEIVHAVEALYPGTSNHGALAGVGALFASVLREYDSLFERMASCLARYDLPRTPSDLGLSSAQFCAAVEHAPSTRPDRYTILEHLDLSADQIKSRVSEYLARLS